MDVFRRRYRDNVQLRQEQDMSAESSAQADQARVTYNYLNWIQFASLGLPSS